MDSIVPEQWKGLYALIMIPIKWLFPLQAILLNFVFGETPWGMQPLKWIFFLLPVVLIITGLWCSMLAVYSLLFRSHRVHIVATFLVLWWDTVRSMWLYWTGMFRFLFVAFGTFWGLLRLIAAIIWDLLREIVGLPFYLAGGITSSLRQPGVPWLAFIMTMVWTLLEATIFTYILTPTISEVISDLVGTEAHGLLSVFLFIMLAFMIAGSFACIQVLTEAIREKDIKHIIQMTLIEIVVMFVEVMFLYRELIDSLSPWIAQQTGVQMGIVPVIILSSMAWIGIRGMVWFLFGRFGTPTLLALIARQRLQDEQTHRPSVREADERWETISKKIKAEQEWFVERANELLEAAVLPVFQLFAAAINFCTVLILSKPLFSLPFKSLSEIKETHLLLQSLIAKGELK